MKSKLEKITNNVVFKIFLYQSHILLKSGLSAFRMFLAIPGIYIWYLYYFEGTYILNDIEFIKSIDMSTFTQISLTLALIQFIFSYCYYIITNDKEL